MEMKLPNTSSVGAKKGFLRGDHLIWKGPVDAETELSAEITSPGYLKVARSLATLLSRPIVAFSQISP